VKINRSEQLLNHLTNNSQYIESPKYDVVTKSVVEVSAIGALQELLRLQRITLTTKQEGDIFVYIHIGQLPESYFAIQLERTGRNRSYFVN
jgi:hypothetical protein